MPRYFAQPMNITENEISIVGDDVKHISNVLRSKIGDKIQVCDGEGFDYDCKISNISKDEIKLSIVNKIPSSCEPNIKIHLFQGLPKSDKMELIIQKCVEIGIYKITPVSTERAIVNISKKDSSKKIARWQSISLSAAKQSGRGIVPIISEVITFKEAIKESLGLDIAFIPYELEKEITLKEIIKNFKGREIGIFIGPEGGFSENEIKLAVENKIIPVTLGKRILRTETAGIVVSSILIYELG